MKHLLARLLPAVLLSLVCAVPLRASAPEGEANDAFAEVDAAFERAERLLAEIERRPAAERTYDNTVRAIDDAWSRLFLEVGYPRFLADVHPDREVRQRAETLKERLSNWFTELMLREELHRAVAGYAALGEDLPAEEARLLSELLRDFRRAGMALDPESRARLKAIDFELTELSTEFSRNIRDDETIVVLTEAELAGNPPERLAQLERSGPLYLVPTIGSVLFPLARDCDVSATRYKLNFAYDRRAGARNVALLEKILGLRAEKARILGYPTYVHYEVETKMSRTPERVAEFYADLVPKLRRKAEIELAEYTAFAREKTGDPNFELAPWDMAYYGNLLRKERYDLDQELVRQYFPMDAVFEAVFRISEDLFGLTITDVSETAAAKGRPLWHADARLYAVHDRASGELLGEFYTDLHPRPNKYNHAAQFPLVFRKRWADGTLTLPVVALVCNFTKPTGDQPALLYHREVVTFFHEFGHCLHSILTEAELSSFAGTQVARDFVEAPSQMLENWIWDPELLASFARHHATGEPMPRSLIEAMIDARNVGAALNAEYQVYLGKMDLAFHGDPEGKVDTTAVSRAVHGQTRLVGQIEGTLQHASFGHLMGYQAGYYGYLWSLVYAQAMFEPFRLRGVMDPELGQRYRRQVLAKGGTRDALDLVREFLGYEPTSDAFLRHLGLELDSSAPRDASSPR